MTSLFSVISFSRRLMAIGLSVVLTVDTGWASFPSGLKRLSPVCQAIFLSNALSAQPAGSSWIGFRNTFAKSFAQLIAALRSRGRDASVPTNLSAPSEDVKAFSPIPNNSLIYGTDRTYALGRVFQKSPAEEIHSTGPAILFSEQLQATKTWLMNASAQRGVTVYPAGASQNGMEALLNILVRGAIPENVMRMPLSKAGASNDFFIFPGEWKGADPQLESGHAIYLVPSHSHRFALLDKLERAVAHGMISQAIYAMIVEKIQTYEQFLSTPIDRKIPPLPVPQFYMGYSVQRVLSSFGMSFVFEAHDADGQAVAIKVDNANPRHYGAAQRFYFQREVDILSHLNRQPATQGDVPLLRHQGVDIHGINYMVMKWVEGETLDYYTLKERNAIRNPGERLKRVLERFSQLALQLSHIHAQDVVHGDIKPQNIQVSHDGLHLTILDFGLSTLRDHHIPHRAGTIRYLSPEGMNGELETTPAMDVYALGLMLMDSVLPLADRQIPLMPGDIRRQIFAHSLPLAVKQLILRATQENPKTRISARQFHNELETILGSPSVISAPASGPFWVLSALRAAGWGVFRHHSDVWINSKGLKGGYAEAVLLTVWAFTAPLSAPMMGLSIAGYFLLTHYLPIVFLRYAKARVPTEVSSHLKIPMIFFSAYTLISLLPFDLLRAVLSLQVAFLHVSWDRSQMPVSFHYQRKVASLFPSFKVEQMVSEMETFYLSILVDRWMEKFHVPDTILVTSPKYRVSHMQAVRPRLAAVISFEDSLLGSVPNLLDILAAPDDEDYRLTLIQALSDARDSYVGLRFYLTAFSSNLSMRGPAFKKYLMERFGFSPEQARAMDQIPERYFPASRTMSPTAYPAVNAAA